MGELYIPNETEIRGPWFIEASDLEELDDVITFVDSKLKESKEKEYLSLATIAFNKGKYENIESATSAVKKYDSSKYEKKIVVISKDDTRLVDVSLKGVLKDHKVKNLYPKEFNVHIQYDYSTKFELTITRRSDGELKYKINCSDSDCREEIRYRVDSWLDKRYPKKGNQIWNRFAFLFGFFSVFCMILSAPFMITSEIPNMQLIYKKDIDSLLKIGINQENEFKAIELLLKHETAYTPEEVKEVQKINKVPIRIFVTALLVFLLSVFYPKTTIGIGKHKALLKFYKFYTMAILITLPVTFILPTIIDWINNLIKG